MIHARGLARTFRKKKQEVHAVAGVDLDVEAGEIVGFLGPNGAGKTTTLRMLLGLVRPDAGTSTVGGVATDGLNQKTMAAKHLPGLYVIGEAVDVTGWLGGYNFQWAWSSGVAAGLAIAARRMDPAGRAAASTGLPPAASG